MKQEVGEFPALLHQVDVRKATNAIREMLRANEFAEHKTGVVEAQGLIEIADEEIVRGPDGDWFHD
jgi:hypothetical protein